jgi:hypothetical protein
MERDLKTIFSVLVIASLLLVSPSIAQDDKIFIDKIASFSSVSPGETLYYAIFYGNPGNDTLVNGGVNLSNYGGIKLSTC